MSEEQPQTKVVYVEVLFKDGTTFETEDVSAVGYLPQGNITLLQIQTQKGNLKNINLAEVKSFKFWNEVIQ